MLRLQWYTPWKNKQFSHPTFPPFSPICWTIFKLMLWSVILLIHFSYIYHIFIIFHQSHYYHQSHYQHHYPVSISFNSLNIVNSFFYFFPPTSLTLNYFLKLPRCSWQSPQNFDSCAGLSWDCHGGSDCLFPLQEVSSSPYHPWQNNHLWQPNVLQQWSVPTWCGRYWCKGSGHKQWACSNYVI